MAGVYFAHPIDQVDGDWYTDATLALDWLKRNSRISWVFQPSGAFSVGGGPRDPAIRRVTGTALELADLVVAVLPSGSVSVGVPMEIDRAARAGKPVLVVSDAPSWMLQFDPDTEPYAAVVPGWDSKAEGWVSEALDGISERRGRSDRAPLPVVIDDGAEGPRRGYEDDAGLDLVVSEYRTVNPGEFVDIPCGVSMQLPEWAWGMITGRSSTLRKRGLMVNQGIIDAGYRGPLFAGVWNLGDEPVDVNPGERIAQLLILENGTRRVDVTPVSSLDPGTRGTAGFGSTGA